MLLLDLQNANSSEQQMATLQAQLYNIRRDPKTYCHEPEGPPEMYENWMESFDLDDYEEEMANMMLECHEVRCLYDQLVPSSVSHSEFWHRYFYRVYLLKKAEAKRLEQVKQTSEELCTEVENEGKEEGLDSKTGISCSDNMAAPPEISAKSAVASVTQESRTLLDKDNGLSSFCLPDSTTSIVSSSSSTACQNSGVNALECKPNKTFESITSQETEFKGKSETEMSDNCSEVSEACIPGKHSPIEVIGDENRSTPSDTASKEYSTGDEWEKDFDLDINVEEPKRTENQETKSKEVGKEDWEKW